MTTTGVHKIRPAGRHILTIGRDLIQNAHAAVLELVKNAYDADSPDVDIKFRGSRKNKRHYITIADRGHGMTRDDVINKWLVPSTSDKLRRHRSPSGRVMQGRKGVGRYAASMLGRDLLLETVTLEGEKTEVYVEWDEFDRAEYLDEVDILVNTTESDAPPGTRLTITLDEEHLVSWNESQFRYLSFELARLKSPVEVALENDDFSIKLSVLGFPNIPHLSETIQPLPLFDLFDYRISGTVNKEGKGILQYSMQKVRNAQDENITFDYGEPVNCGELTLDIRVYDRDGSSISALVGRGLKDESGNHIGNLEARRLLTSYNGIGVYRNGFRIRPLGDPDFDWLKLNEKRVQAPSQRIGSNQVIGFVQIQSEERSGLIEKSARDGLRDNREFEDLKNVTASVIGELEKRRFVYRRRAGLGQPAVKVVREIDKLFSSEELRRNVQQSLKNSGASRRATEDILELIGRDEQDRNRIADDIRQAVAIYQGQATLGKIINVILHEGRRPLNFFRNEIKNLKYSHRLFLQTGDEDQMVDIVSISEGMSSNAEFFVDLFDRLDPLAAGKRPQRAPLDLKRAISESFPVFRAEMEAQNAVYSITCPAGLKFTGWTQDIYVIFTNLIDNSLYWMREKEVPDRRITVTVSTNENLLSHIDYRDTGPGIDPGLISSEVIFEPQFTTKPDGTGLGLAIAGEAATRNDLELRALETKQGAWFRLQPLSENEE